MAEWASRQCCTNYCRVPTRVSIQTTEKQASRDVLPTTTVCLQGIVYQLLQSKPPRMLCKLLQSESLRDSLPTTTKWAFKGCSTNYFSVSLQECCTNSCRVSLHGCCSKYCSESQGMFYQLLQSKPPGMLYQLLQSESPGMLYQLLQSEPSRDGLPTTAEWAFKGWSANYYKVNLQSRVLYDSNIWKTG